MDARLPLLRVQMFTAAQTLKGEDLDYFKESVRDVMVVMDAQKQAPGREPLVLPPVDRTSVDTTDGRPAHEVKLSLMARAC